MRTRRRALAAAVMSLVVAALTVLPATAATTWSLVASPNRGTWVNTLSDASATATGNAWAVGNWYDVNIASTRTLALRWNGSAWSSVTTPNVNNFYNELYGVDATSTTNAWAVGGFATGQSGGGNGNNGPHSTLAMRWNGTSWTRVTTPNPGVSSRDLYDVEAFSTSDAWAAGYYYDTLSPQAKLETLIVHWNGTSWTQVASPNPANYLNTLSGIAGSSPTDIWAVGTYANYGEPNGARHPLALHWNGTAWSQVTVPVTGNAILYGVAALSPTDAWAVGSKNGYRTPVAFHWNGATWTETAFPPLSGTGNNPLYAVAGLASDEVWAVGYRSDGSGPQPLAARWNGSAWSLETLPQLELGGLAHGIAVTPGTAASPLLWAVGYQDAFVGSSITNRTLVLRGTGS